MTDRDVEIEREQALQWVNEQRAKAEAQGNQDAVRHLDILRMLLVDASSQST